MRCIPIEERNRTEGIDSLPIHGRHIVMTPNVKRIRRAMETHARNPETGTIILQRAGIRVLNSASENRIPREGTIPTPGTARGIIIIHQTGRVHDRSMEIASRGIKTHVRIMVRIVRDVATRIRVARHREIQDRSIETSRAGRIKVTTVMGKNSIAE